MTKAIVFVVLSMGLVVLSRASLRTPRFHGTYRFVAWELILALFVLNFKNFGQWFGDPFSIRQLTSWLLMGGSLVPFAGGVHMLLTLGKPDSRRHDDVPLIGIEKTTRLVTTGAYKYIRHPIYSSLLLLAWGVFFKSPSWIAVGLAAGATASLLATAKVEEAENVRYFGPAYCAYMKQTRMFIPFVF